MSTQPSSPSGAARRVRKKMELTLRYRIRASQKDDVMPRNLQIRLTVDGVTVSDYGSGVTVRPSKWNQKDQLVIGRDKIASDQNERLSAIELQHRDILRELKRRYAKGEAPRPTAEMVKREFLRPGSASPTLLAFYNEYLDYLDSIAGLEDGKAEKTLHRAYKVREDIKAFCGMGPEPAAPDKTPQLADIVTGWGKRFHAWLQIYPTDSGKGNAGRHRMNKDSANKYLGHVRDALDYAIDEGYLNHNALDKYRPKRGKGKPVYFLEDDQLQQLLTLEYPGDLGDVLWWGQVMCVTALDYKDAVRFVADRPQYERRTVNGKKIVIERAKPPRNTCEIPMREELEMLLAKHPTGPAKKYELPDVNKYLRTVIGPAVKSRQTFTSKICRKTGGAYFLRLGYAIEAVSKFMGHSSVRTTEQYYVKITTSYVDSEMKRINERNAFTGKLIDKIVPIPKAI